VEGVGDHGCEYMTGGTVVVLGRTGRNFAAGMSGGVAYVWKLDHGKVNPELVDLEPVPDPAALRALVERHLVETGSAVASALLDRWHPAVAEFTAVMPRDYKRVMEAISAAEAAGRDVDEAVMSVAAPGPAASGPRSEATREDAVREAPGSARAKASAKDSAGVAPRA
jgi:glutamate synthase (NADPH/NADH) large chain